MQHQCDVERWRVDFLSVTAVERVEILLEAIDGDPDEESLVRKEWRWKESEFGGRKGVKKEMMGKKTAKKRRVQHRCEAGACQQPLERRTDERTYPALFRLDLRTPLRRFHLLHRSSELVE